jgi:mono/diheme cytochrome c family protein
MPRNSLFLGSLFVGVLAAASAGALASAATAPAKPAHAGPGRAAQVERGRYLVTVMGCGDCHTPGTFYGAADHARMLSGSELGWRGPWGVTFARNLTPDQETGLGYWSEDEIVKAFRSGVKNDGSPVLPPMPWQDFAALTDADAHAIAAYLMSLPPVKHKVPDLLPPGKPYTGAVIEFPPPPAWDAPRENPAGAPGSK